MAASLGLITPELVVLAFAVALLLIDLASPRKELLVSLALLGLLISANLTITMAGSNPGAAFGGMLVIDDFSIVLKVLMLFSTAIVVLASTSYVRHFERFQGEYYSLLLFACAGMMFMASAAEFITIYLSLELTGIALAILAGMMKNRTSSEAGIKYLLLGALSSAVLLYGIVLFFGLTGSTYLTQIQPVLLQSYQENHLPITVATVLLIAGFGFKLATVPFQMWVPDVYQGCAHARDRIPLSGEQGGGHCGDPADLPHRAGRRPPALGLDHRLCRAQRVIHDHRQRDSHSADQHQAHDGLL